MGQYLLFLLFLAPAAVFLFLAILHVVIKPGGAKIPINGRHVFVTGGSFGIGLTIAKLAAQEGARVSILARNLRKLEEARDEIFRSTGAKVSIYSADVRDEKSVREALEHAGTVDVLVCNHGIFLPGELVSTEMEEIKYAIDVNVVGTFNVIRHALPSMQKDTSSSTRSIAILSSQAGLMGVYGYTHYCATKFALRGLAEALQQEVLAHNIRVCLICPPVVETPGYLDRLERMPEMTDMITSTSPKMSMEGVAAAALKGIKSGSFLVPCNWDGFGLSLAGSCGSPATSTLTTLCEIVFSGLIRLRLLFTLRGWYKSIAKRNAEHRRKEVKNTKGRK